MASPLAVSRSARVHVRQSCAFSVTAEKFGWFLCASILVHMCCASFVLCGTLIPELFPTVAGDSSTSWQLCILRENTEAVNWHPSLDRNQGIIFGAWMMNPSSICFVVLSLGAEKKIFFIMPLCHSDGFKVWWNERQPLGANADHCCLKWGYLQACSFHIFCPLSHLQVASLKTSSAPTTSSASTVSSTQRVMESHQIATPHQPISVSQYFKKKGPYISTVVVL